MLLGVSWSPVARTLPDIPDLVDFVEIPGWEIDSARVDASRPLLLHNLDLDVSLANTTYIDDAWGLRVNTTLARTQSRWLSLHLGFACEQVRFDGHMLPVSSPLGQDVLFERIVTSIRRATTYIDVPLLLENLDYCPEGAYEHICEPAFIRAVLDATDAGLLLDLGHLRVSASWFGKTPESLLDDLPLERLTELHISSPRPLTTDDTDPRLDDVHERLTERDFDLLYEVLDRATPQALVLEYRREAGALRRQLQHLRECLNRHRNGA